MDKLKQLFKKWLTAGLITANLITVQHWHNTIEVEHWRGTELIGVHHTTNGIVDVGLNHLLDVTFDAATATTVWFMGLVDNSGFTAFADADTMASHTGWNVFVTYSESVRSTWNPDPASARSISNGTSTDFSINGSGTVKGIFVTSNNVKSGTTGILWATAAFASTIAVSNGDILKITYTISG